MLMVVMPRFFLLGAVWLALPAIAAAQPAVDGLQYIASYPDLIRALGANPSAGVSHYVLFGLAEGRIPDKFNENAYLANYPDLQAAFGTDTAAATMHYITTGFYEQRTDRPVSQPQLQWKVSPIWLGGQGDLRDAGGRPWYDPNFDDSGWSAVSLPFRTTASGVGDHYFRSHFTWDGVSELTIQFASDDGVEIYINGKSFLGGFGNGWRQPGCVNQPGDIICAVSVEVTPYILSGLPEVSNIKPGDNVIVVDLWNGACCDTYLDVTLSQPSPSEPSTALLAPVNNGVQLKVIHGYNDPSYKASSPELCSIATSRDHCANQQFGLDVAPDKGWDGKILAPTSGTPMQVVYGHGGSCLLFQLDSNLNMNVCHFSTVITNLLNKHVERGTILGTASSTWIHLSLDARPKLCTGGWTLPRGTEYFCPVPLTSPYTLEGQSLSPDGTADQWNGLTLTSQNVERP